jgi:hypothetical protein
MRQVMSVMFAVVIGVLPRVARAQMYVVTHLAGSAQAVTGSNDGVGTAARFSNPIGVAVNASGTVYVADFDNHTIRALAPGGVVTTLAGVAGSPGSANGVGAAARFRNPWAVAVDGVGTLYVADTGNHTIRKVTPAGVVSTLAGFAGVSGHTDGVGSAARFHFPSGVAVDAAGVVYVADQENHTVRRVTPAGAVTTIAGLAGARGYADGVGPAARFNDPSGVAVDAAGTVYVSEYGNHTVRRLTPDGTVTTVAGKGGIAGSADGAGSQARFDSPFAIAVDTAGTVFVADSLNHTVRAIFPGGVATTIAGRARVEARGDGTGSAARFSVPGGLAVDAGGSVYIAEYGGHAIRKVAYLLPIPGGRYDADARADQAVCREGAFGDHSAWFLRKSVLAAAGFLWGRPGDVAVTADFDGDGLTDPAMFRGATGQWWVLRSRLGAAVLPWGQAGDVPLPADYDHDGRADAAVFRPSTGTWHIARSTAGALSLQWGAPGDVPIPADFDDDGRADVAVFRPSTGVWYVVPSLTHRPVGFVWGAPGDVPLPGDFDGDGKNDPTVWRPGTGTWYQLRSGTGATAVQWGVGEDVPVVGDYDGDRKADPTVFRAPSASDQALWVHLLSTGVAQGVSWGLPGDAPR